MKWTKEKVFKESKNYTSRNEFSKHSPTSYGISLKNGWLDEMVWLVPLRYKKGYFTKENCLLESKKYNFRSEFKQHCSRGYHISRINGWLDEMVWLSPKNILGENLTRRDNIYVYEFKELNYVYIGRTVNPHTRDRNHRLGGMFKKDGTFKKSKTRTIYEFAEKNNVEIPPMKIVETNITVLEGRIKEGEWLEKYKNNGWNILNKKKCGDLGGLFLVRWTKNKCIEESKKYTSRYDFKKGCEQGYQKSRKMGWLDEMVWLLPKKHTKWTFDECIEVSKKCSSKSEFKERYNGAYSVSLKNGWLNDMIWLIPKTNTWTKEKVFEESKNYKNRRQFRLNVPGAYFKAYKNGWLNELYPKK